MTNIESVTRIRTGETDETDDSFRQSRGRIAAAFERAANAQPCRLISTACDIWLRMPEGFPGSGGRRCSSQGLIAKLTRQAICTRCSRFTTWRFRLTEPFDLSNGGPAETVREEIDESAVTGGSMYVLREADGDCEVMHDTLVVAGRILVEVTPRLGHPLDWITGTTADTRINEPAMKLPVNRL